MAISPRAAGAWGANNASGMTVTIPVGSSAGDLMVMHFACKPYTASPTVNQGWTVVGTSADGTVVNGNGTGSVRGGVAYKVHTGSETNPTITWGTTSAPGIAVIITFQKGAGEQWSTPVTVFGNVNNSTAINAAVASDPGVTAGDMCIAGIYTRDNSTLTVPTFTQTGVTFGTVAEYPAAAIATTTSNDMAGDSCYRLASSGTGSAAPVITATQAAAETGVLSFTRLRVSTGVQASAGHASGAGAVGDEVARVGAASIVASGAGAAADATTHGIDGAGVALATGSASDVTVAGPTIDESEAILGRLQLGAAALADTSFSGSPAGGIAAVGLASSPTTRLGGIGGVAAATGAAGDLTVNKVDGIGAVAATGEAYDSGPIFILCYAEAATASATASDLTTVQAANAGVASATAATGNVTSGAGAQAVSATAAVLDARTATGALAETIAVTGSAPDAGVTVGGDTAAQPGPATASAAALDALVAIGAVSESAAATAAAWGAPVALQTVMELAPGEAAAYDASITAQSNAGAASATVTAWDVSTPVGSESDAAAYDASVWIGTIAEVAPAIGLARDMQPQALDNPPGSGSARAPSLSGTASQAI